MKTVWKYEIHPDDDMIAIEMPVGAEVLSVQIQRGQPVLWALVDTDAIHRMHYFHIARTGYFITHPVERHLGTFQLDGGAPVFHLFQLPGPRGLPQHAESIS